MLDVDAMSACESYDPYWTSCTCCGKRHVTVCWTPDWQNVCDACIDGGRLLPTDQRQLKAERAEQIVADARADVPSIEALGDPEPEVDDDGAATVSSKISMSLIVKFLAAFARRAHCVDYWWSWR